MEHGRNTVGFQQRWGLGYFAYDQLFGLGQLITLTYVWVKYGVKIPVVQDWCETGMGEYSQCSVKTHLIELWEGGWMTSSHAPEATEQAGRSRALRDSY